MDDASLGRHLPVVLVHGYNFWGESDALQWDDLRAALSGWGWRAGINDVRYYGCEQGMDLDAHLYGEHASHNPNGANHASECQVGAHDYNTDIQHLAYHLAWLLHDEYTAEKECVVVIAHSMGGLITRYALQATGEHPDFPEALCVKGVATMGTPHNGQGLCGGDFQSCTQMAEGSIFLQGLGPAPQSRGGTKWITIGSLDDWVVPAESALGLQGASAAVVYAESMNVHHANGKTYLSPTWSDAYNDGPTHGANDATAVAYAWIPERQELVPTREAPWPARVADLELAGISVVYPPFEPTAHRQDPAAGELAGEPGVDYVFHGACDDPLSDLEGTRWDALIGGSWYEVEQDLVQVHDDPWTTSTTVPGQDASYTLRLTCLYGDVEASTQWHVDIAEDYLAADEDIVVPAESYYYVPFHIDSGDAASFTIDRRDTSSFHVGILESAQFDAFSQGYTYDAYCRHADVGYAEDQCRVPAGEYYLVVECANSFYDCDLTYWLRVN